MLPLLLLGGCAWASALPSPESAAAQHVGPIDPHNDQVSHRSIRRSRLGDCLIDWRIDRFMPCTHHDSAPCASPITPQTLSQGCLSPTPVCQSTIQSNQIPHRRFTQPRHAYAHTRTGTTTFRAATRCGAYETTMLAAVEGGNVRAISMCLTMISLKYRLLQLTLTPTTTARRPLRRDPLHRPIDLRLPVAAPAGPLLPSGGIGGGHQGH